MVARIFKYAIVIALAAILVYFLTQEEYQNAMKDAWQDVTHTDAWKTFKKTWQKSYKKTQQLFTNAQNGKLSVEIGTSLDASSRLYLGVGLTDLQGYLKRLDSGTAGTILLTVWLVLGYFLYKVTSTGTSFFVMSILLLAHSIYGQTWCLYQLCIVAGIGMYFISLISGNAVLAAILVVIVYTISTFVFFVSRPESNIYSLEEKLDHYGYRTMQIEQRLSSIDKKLDRIFKKKKNHSSSGDE